MSENLLDRVYIDSEAFSCNQGFDECTMKERSVSYALFVTVPEQEEPPEAIFKECCYTNYVYASSTDTDLEKNDFAGFYHQRQNTAESNEFVLIRLSDSSEYILNDNTYGLFKDFGDIDDNDDLSTFVIQWRLVLAALGADNYKVVKRVTTTGLTVEIEYLTYTLREYSSQGSDTTVRIDITMSGLLEKPGIDFTGSDFAHSIRVPGFFGRREPQYEEDNIINRNYVKRQVSIRQTNEYQFQTQLIPVCITEEIFDFFLLSDDIRMFDYNLNNHSYDFKNFPVKFSANSGTVYGNRTRKAQLNLVFNDKTVNNNKRNF